MNRWEIYRNIPIQPKDVYHGSMTLKPVSKTMLTKCYINVAWPLHQQCLTITSMLLDQYINVAWSLDQYWLNTHPLRQYLNTLDRWYMIDDDDDTAVLKWLQSNPGTYVLVWYPKCKRPRTLKNIKWKWQLQAVDI